MMNGRRKSDNSVIPAKSPNQAEGPAAEVAEGRELAKGNWLERNALRAQGRDSALSALERVRQAARKDRKQRFTALLHHIYDVERLRVAYLTTQKGAAAGIDGETSERETLLAQNVEQPELACTIYWKHFQRIKEQFPLLRPKLYLPYMGLQAIAVL
jgi:hypothetical protein